MLFGCKCSRLLLVLVASVMSAAPVAADTCLVLDVRFPGQVHDAVLVKAMWTEVSAIWSTYGVRIISASDSQPAETDRVGGSFEVSIVRPRKHSTKFDRLVLGTTRLQQSAIEHSPIQIDYGAVEELLREVTASEVLARTGHSCFDSADLGRALGRVLAHEIGHVLLLAPDHQPQGLMRASFAPADMLRLERGSFTLSKSEIARLREREEQLASSADQADQ